MNLLKKKASGNIRNKPGELKIYIKIALVVSITTSFIIFILGLITNAEIYKRSSKERKLKYKFISHNLKRISIDYLLANQSSKLPSVYNYYVKNDNEIEYIVFNRYFTNDQVNYYISNEQIAASRPERAEQKTIKQKGDKKIIGMKDIFERSKKIDVKEDYHEIVQRIEVEGVVVGYLRIGITDKIFSAKIRNYLLYMAGVSSVGLLFLILIIFFVIKRMILKPLNLVVEMLQDVSEGRKIPESKIGYLANTFEEMVNSIKDAKQKLKDYSLNLEKKVTQRTKKLNETNKKLSETMDALWGEMELAKKIQTILLPKDPQIPGYLIDAKMIPAEKVGGDYYDFLTGSDGRHWVGIGDVTGHGITPGLIMMMTETAVSSIIKSQPSSSPKDVVINLNKVLFENIRGRLKEQHHMTFSIMNCTPEGEIIYAGAHEDFILYRSRLKKCEIIPTKGLWVGILPEISEKTFETKFFMEKNDILVLYTDGIIEARNSDRKIYGTDKLIDEIERNAELSVKELKEKILNSVLNYAYIQADDITLVIIKKLPNE